MLHTLLFTHAIRMRFLRIYPLLPRKHLCLLYARLQAISVFNIRRIHVNMWSGLLDRTVTLGSRTLLEAPKCRCYEDADRLWDFIEAK